MVARVQKTQTGYVVPLTAEMVATLQLSDGSEVELQAVASATNTRYATVEEVLDAYRLTLPEHANTYRELAK